MSQAGSDILAAAVAKYGQPPESFAFGDGIAWDSPLVETRLYVELPFWLMTSPTTVTVDVAGTDIGVDICEPWQEVFGREVTDSRVSVGHNGPVTKQPWTPPPAFDLVAKEQGFGWMSRHCKTVLRISTRAHTDPFRMRDEATEPPRVQHERDAYLASLCEAHLPAINELIQRYRLVTYDYFAYEVSAWDVPIWYLKQGGQGRRAVLLPYKDWDEKPVTIEDGASPGDPPVVRSFEWCVSNDLASADSSDATPGEFDLLDARSLMERGDYTGAVRRSVTAIEAVLGWALFNVLRQTYDEDDARERAARTANDFPGRLAQWRRLANPTISQIEFDQFEETRQVRHRIVHRGHRLTLADRGDAQRAVDTGRWLYNKIEGRPARSRLRDYGVLKSAGRVAMTVRFPTVLTSDGFRVEPLFASESKESD